VLLILIMMFCMFFSCQKDSSTPTPTPTPTPTAPVAGFTFSGAVVAPSTVTFTNSSTNASSYIWDFGDNGTSNEVSPTHIFSKGGVYSVKLTATGSGGTNSITKLVNIRNPINFKIIAVKITAIPLTKTNGASWDVSPSSGPDVTFTIEKVPYNVQYDHPFYIQDVASSSLPLNFILQNSSNEPKPILLPIDNNLFALNIYDYDPPSSIEKIASITFVPKDYITGTGSNAYPTTLKLSYGGVTAELTVEYE
jgi:PKD repeat protein